MTHMCVIRHFQTFRWEKWSVSVSVRLDGEGTASGSSRDFTHLCCSHRSGVLASDCVALTSGYESLAKTWRRAVFPHWASPTTTILQRSNPLLSIAPRVITEWLRAAAHLSFSSRRVEGRGSALSDVNAVGEGEKRVRSDRDRNFSTTVWWSFGYMLCAPLSSSAPPEKWDATTPVKKRHWNPASCERFQNKSLEQKAMQTIELSI